ncbi:MAG: hypothetical protein RR203_07850 [Synergistaceae bacterium]
MDEEKIFCPKCRKTIEAKNFYTVKNKEKYPTGRINLCKKCLTLHVNSWEPTTFISILKDIDVPYIESEWNVLLDKFAKDPKKVTGVTILGRYLSKMKLKQYSDFVWADTATIAAEEKAKAELQSSQVKGQLGRYAKALSSSDLLLLEKNPEDLTEEDLANMTDEELQQVFAQPHQKPEEEDEWQPYVDKTEPVVDVDSQLTADDRLYLNMKWGKLYRAEEWISLEKFYEEMLESFDVQGAAHLDYLKMICKTSLKMNQAINLIGCL